MLIDATVWCLDAERFWLFTGRRAGFGGHDVSGAFAILALQGPASGWILARLLGPDAVTNLRYFRFLEKDGLIVARLGFSGELGYELLVPASEAATLRHKLLEAGRNEGLRACSWAAADSLRIEAGYVLFDREVDGRANPRELGLERFAPQMNFHVERRLVGLDILDGPGRSDLPPRQGHERMLLAHLRQVAGAGIRQPRHDRHRERGAARRRPHRPRRRAAFLRPQTPPSARQSPLGQRQRPASTNSSMLAAITP